MREITLPYWLPLMLVLFRQIVDAVMPPACPVVCDVGC